MHHSAVMFLDVDLRNAWYPHSGLSRGLLVNFKWKVVHGSTNLVRRIVAKS